jgi:hypothetical protein
MSERLNELQHQRALLQEHLAWIEREIAAEMTRSGLPAPSAPVAVPAPPAREQWPAPARPPAAASPAATEQQAETILQQYRDESKNLRQDVRKGCFLYFALAMVLLGAGVVALYFATLRKH